MIDLSKFRMEPSKHLGTEHIINLYLLNQKDMVGFVNILAKKIYIWGIEQEYTAVKLSQEQFETIKLTIIL